MRIRFPKDRLPLGGCDAGKLIYVYTDGQVAVCPYLVFAARTPASRYADREVLVGNILHDDVAAGLDGYDFHTRYTVAANPTCEACAMNRDCGKGCPAAIVSRGGRIGDIDDEQCSPARSTARCGLTGSPPCCPPGHGTGSPPVRGSKGERDYDWAWVAITPPAGEAAGCHSLLIRRRVSDGELAFYRCWSPRPVPLRTLVRVAGTRWNVETCFQTGKRIGPDEPQVRRWDSWYRHITLVILAHAILTVVAARARDAHTDQTLVALTFNEIRRLFARMVTNTIHTIDHWLHWSTWRRRHQASAKTSHYRRRGQLTHQPTST